MLFLRESVLETKTRLMLDLESGKGDREQTLQKVLALDPDDYLCLAMLSQAKLDAGDRAGAQELLWRAIHAQPCSWVPYMQLSVQLAEEEALSNGLSELASRKMAADESALSLIEDKLAQVPGLDLPELEGLSGAQRLAALILALREKRELEPVEVTSRLRPYRLIAQLQEVDSLDRATAEVLVQEGASLLPLLIGVLRGWARDVLSDDQISAVRNSLGLLGEMGDPGAIVYLLDVAGTDEPEIAGPCRWALNRIAARHPEEAGAALRKIAPELEGDSRVAAAQMIVQNPRIDPDGVLLESLFENFDRVDEQVREDCFQALLATMFVLLGRNGVERARVMLRRNRGMLSRNVRRQCEEMLEEFLALGPVTPPPPPEPSPWTVFQICHGEVDWEAELAAQEDDEDDEYFPEPIRKAPTPERNDPCWCGSGKKYKKCHLEADEEARREKAELRGEGAESPLGELDATRQEVGEILSKLPQQENRAAIAEFYGDEDFDQETGVSLLVDWIVHDRISERLGRTVMEEYRYRNGSQLTERARQFVESSIASFVDLLEVQEVKEGTGLEVKSLTSGETRFVHDISLSKKLVVWDGLLARTVDAERGLEFSGVVNQVPRRQLDTLRAWMQEDKRRTGLTWPVYLKRNWPRIRARNIELGEERLDALQFKNGDGDEIALSKATYRIASHGALVAALRSCAEIDEAKEGASFTWLNGPAGSEGLTVLGTITITGSELTFECNSRERLARGKKMLDEVAGRAVSFQKDDFTTQADLKRVIRENPGKKSSPRDEPSPELERQVVGEYMERHYAAWPDMKLPALDRKTPRQAVKNAAGKRKVAQLLREFENGEERKRKAGEYAYDINRLRAELGIPR